MGEMLLILGEDGVTSYNGEFDVTIHCENEQEMDEAVALLNLANRMHWRKTAENQPTSKDGNEIGSILCAGYHCNIRDGMWLENIMPWHVVRDNPGKFPLWMPLPKLPDLSVPERRYMMGND